MKKIILMSGFMAFSSLYCNLEISAESVAPYKKTITPFIEKKRSELAKLNYLPSSDSFFGSIANYFVGSVVSPLLGYGEINIDHARTFLARAFADEKKLQEAIESIENNPDNILFIRTIFSQVSQETIEKQKKSDFFKAVRTVRHTKVPLPKAMGEKDAAGNYQLADNDFYNYAASNFMTFHIFESNGITKKKTAHRKKGKLS